MDERTTQPGEDVFVLGAGFSRAISDSMPLTDELGNKCLEDESLRLDPRVPPGGFHKGNFEVWLSQLADEQPYLSAEENLDNQALFQRFSGAIAKRLGESVYDALAEGMPQWLAEFLRLCHLRKSSLITFNYDTLVECAVKTGLLHEFGEPNPVYWGEVIGNVPSWPSGTARVGSKPIDTFALLKLHGSLNWYWSPGDASGVSMARRDLPGTFGSPESYDERDRRRELPGRVPFVVPPSATKSPYYRNPIIRQVWQQAAEALRAASRVVLMGYSLPSSDLTFGSMLTNALARGTAKVLVVDLNPRPIVDRVRRLGVERARVDDFGPRAGSPIAEFVARLRDEQAENAAADVATESAELPMLAYWGQGKASAIVGWHRKGDDLVLEAEELAAVSAATRSRNLLGLRQVPRAREIVPDLSKSKKLAIEAPGGGRQFVIDVSRWTLGVGESKDWIVLTPSGTAP